MDSRQSAGGYSFAGYIRTGRLIRTDARWGAREVKFNPYHDPANGQFTSADGAGESEGTGGPTDDSQTPNPDPRNAENWTYYTVQPDDTLSSIAARRVGITAADLQWLNDLSDDRIEAGATLKLTTQDYLDNTKRDYDTFQALSTYIDTHGKLPPDVAHPPSLEEQAFGPGTHVVERNGYSFYIDGEGRTREVKGTITLSPDQVRSRAAQAAAGGDDRLPSDQGGHYIARRFNGPTETFNHFAQDGSFNRSAYAQLENDWAKATKAGARVHVTIEPFYSGSSRRPASLEVRYTVGGIKGFQQFPNDRNARHVR